MNKRNIRSSMKKTEPKEKDYYKTFTKTTQEGKWLYWVSKNRDGNSYISAVKRLV